MKTLNKLVMGVVSFTLFFNSNAMIFANEDLESTDIVEKEEETVEKVEETDLDEIVELDDNEIIEEISEELNEEIEEEVVEEKVVEEVNITSSNLWDDLDEVLVEDYYDFNDYDANAYLEENGKYNYRVFVVDNKTVKITSNNKEINGIQIVVKNGGNLILEDIVIRNVNPKTNRIQNKKESVVFANDNSNNTLTINKNVSLTTESKGAAVAINQGSKLNITGSGSLTAKGGLYRLDGNTHTGAIIGGEGDNPYGTIIFSDKVKVFASGLDYKQRGAAIGGGESAVDNPNLERGSILIKDNVNITAKADGGAAIGSGYSYHAISNYEQGSITIQDNATVNAQAFGSNTAAIGITQNTTMMQINIKDNAHVTAAVKSEYNPFEYKDNLGFGKFVWEAGGSAIGVSEQFSFPALVEDVINISGNPTIIAGGNSGGITNSNGNLNISGGNITIFVRSMSGIGLSGSGLLLADNEVASGKVNISGKDTKINISSAHVVTQEDIDSSGVFDNYTAGELNDYSYGTGIGYRVKQEFGDMEINIEEASINIESYKGAGIGTMARDDYAASATINIFNQANIDVETVSGAAIGTGQQANNSLDIIIDDSTLNLESVRGTGIGAGTYAAYNKNEGNKPIINIVANNSKITSESVDGAGIGGSLGSSSKTTVELNNSDVKAISLKTGAGIGGGRKISTYDYAAADVIINGGKVYAEAYHGAGIGGGKLFNSNMAEDDQTNKGTLSEGTLKIIGSADVLALSNGQRVEPLRLENMDENFYYRNAITAKLLSGSDLTMQSHTLHPDLKRENNIKVNVFNDDEELVRDFELDKYHSSYAYTTMDSSSTTYTEDLLANGKERPLYQIEDLELGIKYREKDRHPNKDEYKAVSEYEGRQVNPLDDNTFIMASLLITYNGNGNTNGVEPSDDNGYKDGEVVTVLGAGSLERVGYKFVGWTLNADGSGKVYEENDTLNFIDTDIELFAKWEINPITQYTVTYTDGVDGETIFDDLVFTVDVGSSTPLYPNDLNREGYKFVKWSPEVKDIVNESITYTAVWEEKEDNIPMVPIEPIIPFEPIVPSLPKDPEKPTVPKEPIIPDDNEKEDNSKSFEDIKKDDVDKSESVNTGISDVTAKMLLMFSVSGLALLTIYLKDRNEKED